jgi:hypothetical protein
LRIADLLISDFGFRIWILDFGFWAINNQQFSEGIKTAAVGQTIARRAVAPQGAKADERKVRTPQGSAPGNARSGQPEGKWHRKHTANGRSQGLRGQW